MERQELLEKTGGVQHIFTKHLGSTSFHGVIPGTGWKQGLEAIFKPEGELPYSSLVDIHPGANVPGHSKALAYGTVEGKPVLRIGRIHNNETKDPEVNLAMRMILDALKDNLANLVITNGVGTLHGQIPDARGWLVSQLRTLGVDFQAFLMRSRSKQEIGIGDVCVVDSFDTRYLGPSTPLLAGEFEDLQHNGYGGEEGSRLKLAQTVVSSAQGYAPLARLAYLFGPQFEDTGVKLTLRRDGCDVVGMSGTEGLVATKNRTPFIHLALATNGAFVPHSHAGNEATGQARTSMLGEILKTSVKTDWK